MGSVPCIYQVYLIPIQILVYLSVNVSLWDYLFLGLRGGGLRKFLLLKRFFTTSLMEIFVRQIFALGGKLRIPQNFQSNIGNVNCFVVVVSRGPARSVSGSSALIRVTPYFSISLASSNWDSIAGTIPQQQSMTSLTAVSSKTWFKTFLVLRLQWLSPITSRIW